MWDAKSYKNAMVGPSRLVGNVGCAAIIAFGQPQAGLLVEQVSSVRPACGCPKAMIGHPTLPTSLDGPTMAFL